MAVALAKKAVDLVPASRNYWNTLGAAHCCAASWKEAVAALEKSMKLHNGGDSFDWFFLAMAHWQLGDKVLARKWYRAATLWMDKHAPGNAELRRFRDQASALLGVTGNDAQQQSSRHVDLEIWTLVVQSALSPDRSTWAIVWGRFWSLSVFVMPWRSP